MEEKYQVQFGVQKATFEAMLAILERAYEEICKRGGRKRKLSVLDMLIIMFAYYRDYRTMENIWFEYGVHKQRISEALNWVEQTLLKDGTFSLLSKRELYYVPPRFSFRKVHTVFHIWEDDSHELITNACRAGVALF